MPEAIFVNAIGLTAHLLRLAIMAVDSDSSLQSVHFQSYIITGYNILQQIIPLLRVVSAVIIKSSIVFWLAYLNHLSVSMERFADALSTAIFRGSEQQRAHNALQELRYHPRDIVHKRSLGGTDVVSTTASGCCCAGRQLVHQPCPIPPT